MPTYLDSTSTRISKTTNLQGLIAAWKSNLNLRVNANEITQDTASAYGRGATKFITWLGEKQVSADVIREWKADLLNNKIKSSSVNVWIAGLRSFFGWLAEVGEIPFDPTQAIRGASRKGTKSRHVRESLTDREVLRLLEQPNRETRAGVRDYAMLCVMLYTAARGVELYRADIEDLRTMDGALVLQVQGKGHYEKDDFLVLSHEAESAMRDWLVLRGKENGALFTSSSNYSKGARLSRRALRGIVKGYFDTAGLQGNKTTHSLRHTAITSAIRHNATIQKVKGMSRHASIDTLMIYYHEVDRLTDPAEKYISYGEE